MARQKSFHVRTRRASLMVDRLKGTEGEEEGSPRAQTTRLRRVRGDGACPQPNTIPTPRATCSPSCHPVVYSNSCQTPQSRETQLVPHPLAHDHPFTYPYHCSQKMPLHFLRRPRRATKRLQACKAALIRLLPANCFAVGRRREEEVEQMFRDDPPLPHSQAHSDPNGPIGLHDHPEYEKHGQKGTESEVDSKVGGEVKQGRAEQTNHPERRTKFQKRITTTTELITHFEQIIMAELGRNILKEWDVGKAKNPKEVHNNACASPDLNRTQHDMVKRAHEQRIQSAISEVDTARSDTPITRGEMTTVPRVSKNWISFSRCPYVSNETPWVQVSDPLSEVKAAITVKDSQTNPPKMVPTPVGKATHCSQDHIMRLLLGEVQNFVSELEGSLTAMAEATQRQGELLVERMLAMEFKLRGAH